ncbi:hypothetical protein IU501_34525 [Nocardia otitidiscaviarum]|uniref:hypothetical protein n=1 Tax=Nocardia otitidiscaviarum TaxID=1823 RepID=UPI001894C91B|nr:hypothetical protein [Nocardia otitidiscaviarum]MBF6138086.1 hypothetical protein [Nocardia otitidiscaviarum]
MTEETTSRPLIFLDTETTHLNPRLRRPWEIAMIRRPALEGLPDRLTILIEDVDLADADPVSLNIGRYYERHPNHNNRVPDDDRWEASPSWRCTRIPGIALDESTVLMTDADAAAEIEEWTAGAQLIGLVPEFDASTLDTMLRRHRLLPRWHYQTIDVETEAAGWLKGRLHAGDNALTGNADDIRQALIPPRNSDALSLLCGVEPPSDTERHTAMGDAAWTERWWDALTSEPPAPTRTPSWTQAVCEDCWDARHNHRPANRAAIGVHEICCYCGTSTHSGIYVRIDPATVAFPQQETNA